MSTLRQGAYLIAALALAACASTPPEEDPVQIRLKDLDTRLGHIERVVNNQSLVELGQRVDTLEADVRTLRGQLEELQNADESLRKQQRDFYTDLDRRIAALEGAGRGTGSGAGGLAGSPGSAGVGVGGSSSAGPSASDSASAGAGASPGNPAGAPLSGSAASAGEPPDTGATGNGASAANPAEQTAYTQAFDLLKGGNYPAAVAAFKSFLVTYPLSELASNAQYWLGETYYVTRDFENALAAFQRVVRDWPASRKAPDALVKLGYAQAELKRYAAAHSTFDMVIAQYPGTDAAKLARDRLAKLPTP
jgi:tol-pal system protein YbgF